MREVWDEVSTRREEWYSRCCYVGVELVHSIDAGMQSKSIFGNVQTAESTATVNKTKRSLAYPGNSNGYLAQL